MNAGINQTVIRNVGASLGDILPTWPDFDSILFGLFVVLGCIIGIAFGLWLLTRNAIPGFIILAISVIGALLYFGVI